MNALMKSPHYINKKKVFWYGLFLVVAGNASSRAVYKWRVLSRSMRQMRRAGG